MVCRCSLWGDKTAREIGGVCTSIGMATRNGACCDCGDKNVRWINTAGVVNSDRLVNQDGTMHSCQESKWCNWLEKHEQYRENLMRSNKK